MLPNPPLQYTGQGGLFLGFGEAQKAWSVREEVFIHLWRDNLPFSFSLLSNSFSPPNTKYLGYKLRLIHRPSSLNFLSLSNVDVSVWMRASFGQR